eukprot:scaffold3388_cov264-Pinguiococcus_pyrenoidosus.AAC.4
MTGIASSERAYSKNSSAARSSRGEARRQRRPKSGRSRREPGTARRAQAERCEERRRSAEVDAGGRGPGPWPLRLSQLPERGDGVPMHLTGDLPDSRDRSRRYLQIERNPRTHGATFSTFAKTQGTQLWDGRVSENTPASAGGVL